MPHKDPERRREFMRRYQAVWRRKNKKNRRDTVLRHRYGIDGATWDAMFERQDGLCAVCQERTATHVDHDHQTGRVRGLLCHQCNVAAGLLKDDPAVALALARYLIEHAS